MNKTIWITIIGIMFLIGWVYISNIVGETLYLYENLDDNTEESDNSEISGTEVKVGVSQSVGVSVKRERWYGTIYEEYNSKKNLNIIYLFDLIKLTINVNNISFALLHLLVFSIVILSIIGSDIYYLRKGGNYEKNFNVD